MVAATHSSCVLDPFSLADDEGTSGQDFKKAIKETPRGTFRDFLLAALLAHGGLFAGSLGVMLWVFRGQRLLGGGLAIAGLLALGLTVVVYRRHKRTLS